MEDHNLAPPDLKAIQNQDLETPQDLIIVTPDQEETGNFLE